MKHISIFILLLALFPLSGIAQKAYETERYSGKLQGQTIELKLADGYIGASEIKLLAPHSSKIILYRPDSGVPDENYQITFSADGKTGAGYFILKNMQDAYDELPAAIYGQFKSGNKILAVKLLKSRR